MRVFTLTQMRAPDAYQVVQQLFGGEVSIALDERTNSIIVKGPPSVTDAIYALLVKLDEPGAAARREGDGAAMPGQAPPGPPVAEIAALYESKDREAARLAAEMQRLAAGSPEDPKRAGVRKQELRRAVADAFAARQKLHQAELAQLSSRLNRIESMVAARERIADQIIDRRVEELLNPALRWDETAAPRATSASARSRVPNLPAPGTSPPLQPASPTSGTSAASPGQTVAGDDEPPTRSLVDVAAAREYREMLRERWQLVRPAFERGVLSTLELLQTARDLREAELAGAATADEKVQALQQHVQRLRDVKSIVDAKISNEVEPRSTGLAVDAEVLKAEAELRRSQVPASSAPASAPPAARNPPANVSPKTSGTITPPPPVPPQSLRR